VLTSVKPVKNGLELPAVVATAEALPALAGLEELLPPPPQPTSTTATTPARVKIDVLGTWFASCSLPNVGNEG
jgi:hypothetical protein